MEKRYLVCPGEVISKNDSEEHFVSATALISLYKVDRRECIIQNYAIPEKRYPKNLIRLRPKENGKYELPQGEKR